MWSLYLFVATISFIYGQNYQDLGADLPLPLGEHITGVYGGYLYVFGGKNYSGPPPGTDDQFNDRFWRLPLSSIQLSGTDDITGFSGSWQEISVTAPSYGISSTTGAENQFACKGQCYAQIEEYLYIVGAYTSTTNEFTTQNVIYRLDLSQDPPVFAGENDFISTTGYGTATYGQCVTSINNVLYTLTGDGQDDVIAYTPSPESQESLTAYTGSTNKFYSGCGEGATEDNKLWLLGGGVQPNVYADDYDITSGEWETRSFGDPGAFDTGSSGTNTRSRARTKCLASRYGDFIECVGGVGVGTAYDTAVLYDTTAYETGATANTYSNLLSYLQSAGFNSISLLEDTTNYVAAELMIVTGGYGSSSSGTSYPDASATVQYAVRYSNLPGPSEAPTKSPTNNPSGNPTERPTQDPTCSGCTRAPSGSPTSAAPTASPIPTEDPTTSPVDETGGSSASQLCIVVSIILALISVIIV